ESFRLRPAGPGLCRAAGAAAPADAGRRRARGDAGRADGGRLGRQRDRHGAQMTLLAAHDLAAAYDGRMVFSGLDLALGPGAHALTGHNGSGKSTLLRLLAGAQAPAAGRVTIAGHDLARDGLAARRQLSY